MAIAMDIRTKRQQEVLDRYKELVYSLYFEPMDSENIVGSFQTKDQDALPTLVIPRKRKSEPEKWSSKDESVLKEISFFICTTRKTKKVLDVKVIRSIMSSRFKVYSTFHSLFYVYNLL